MKIHFYAHACFGLEADGFRVITDPYEPGVSWFAPIDEPADVVLMSSDTDRFHCDPSHVQGEPTVVNTLQVPAGGLQVKKLHVRAFPTRERYQLKLLLRGYRPRMNAMYAFDLGGVRVLHTGDIGRKMKGSQVRELRGNVDVMFALSGGVHNIEVDDMKRAIDQVGPKVVIPMHYYSPKGRLQILPVDEIARRFPSERVVRVGGPEVELAPATLPSEPHLYILEQSR